MYVLVARLVKVIMFLLNFKMLLLVYFVVTYPSLSLAFENIGITEWLDPGSVIEFNAKQVPHHFLLNRLNWVEKNERSTSKNYTLWEELDLYLLEWPGNVTRFDEDNPVVKWGRQRAKYIEDHCGRQFTGIEMKAYAYKYVYLTWGPYRLTKTYSPPLTVPRSILQPKTLAKLSKSSSHEPNKLNTIVAYDIAFTYDTLLLAYSCGIIRISGLEMAWAELASVPKTHLKYSISKGIRSSVDRIIVQSCCLKTDYCPFGDVVVAYKESSDPHLIYMSYDGGENFIQLPPLNFLAGRLHAVLSYPESKSLLIVHGNSPEIKVTQGIVNSGVVKFYNKTVLHAFRGKGMLQGSRLGMEMSFILWDKCNVWYSPELGLDATKSLFYINKDISVNPIKKQRILTEQCSFGKMSTLAYGTQGKFGILDENNVFFMGIDSKSNNSQLVALKVDMSLLIKGTESSVHPYFDNLEQPKLLYPPKFLQIPKMLVEGNSYKRRLGMRLLPKNVYPSDFILVFYEENAKMTSEQRMYGLKNCETSSLQVNHSITQRTKYYSIPRFGNLNFTISFSSMSSSLKQLMFEPRRILKIFNVTVRPISIDTKEWQSPRYIIKYRVIIKPSTASAVGKVFKVNFFTKSSLRCNHLPRIPIYIKVDEKLMDVSQRSSDADDDMSRTVYLKSVGSEGETTYFEKGSVGETFKVDACPATREVKAHLLPKSSF